MTDERESGSKPQLVNDRGRPIVVVGDYEGHGSDDPHGWYWRYADEKTVHWVSATGFSVRFMTLEQWKARQAASGGDCSEDR